MAALITSHQVSLFDIISYIVSVLGQEEGCTVKFTHPPEGVPEGKAQGNS